MRRIQMCSVVFVFVFWWYTSKNAWVFTGNKISTWNPLKCLWQVCRLQSFIRSLWALSKPVPQKSTSKLKVTCTLCHEVVYFGLFLCDYEWNAEMIKFYPRSTMMMRFQNTPTSACAFHFGSEKQIGWPCKVLQELESNYSCVLKVCLQCKSPAGTKPQNEILSFDLSLISDTTLITQNSWTSQPWYLNMTHDKYENSVI